MLGAAWGYFVFLTFTARLRPAAKSQAAQATLMSQGWT